MSKKYLLYSPKPVPGDFHIFVSLKKHLGGQHLKTNVEVKQAGLMWLHVWTTMVNMWKTASALRGSVAEGAEFMYEVFILEGLLPYFFKHHHTY